MKAQEHSAASMLAFAADTTETSGEMPKCCWGWYCCQCTWFLVK